MGNDNDSWQRRREREREKDEEISAPGSASPSAGHEKIHQVLEQIAPLIEQLNNLYSQYFSGAEKHPPIERRKHLDQLMATLSALPKPTPAVQFRSQALQASYITHRDRWDRILKANSG